MKTLRYQDQLNHTTVTRPNRHSTKGIVYHRIGDAPHNPGTGVGRTVEDIIKFYRESPWGVATVLISDPTRRLEAVEDWTRTGVPKIYRDQAFVPYTKIVDIEGVVHNLLPGLAEGAHAYGYNGSGIGIAFIGHFDYESPTAAQVETAIALGRELVVYFARGRTIPKILTHDQARVEHGQVAKGCPGHKFPFKEIKSKILTEVASIMDLPNPAK